MVDSAELGLAVAAACVFGVAGALKLVGEPTLRYRALAVAELAVAGAILAPASRPFGFLTGSLLGIAFTAYSLRSVDRPCRCFGTRLRVTSRNARSFRAFVLLLFSAGGEAAWLASRAPNGSDHWRMTSIALGAVAATLVLVLPAVLTADVAVARTAASNPEV